MENAKREKLRQCVGCRSILPKQSLTRIIRTPDGHVEVDYTGRKNGRGAYICPGNTKCLVTAFKHKALDRALKVSLDEETVERLKKELEDGCSE
ncbi:MAG: YlxR family protein [Lachnospiraceae bacterium]|nr:YlxR family protein [Candidatus Equihabitans merdae]